MAQANPESAQAASSARLAEVRKEIDAVDSRLLELLNQRARLSREVGALKASEGSLVFKPLREQNLLDKLAQANAGPLPESHLRAIWREILSSSRALQRPQSVAYLGPEGTFSHLAGVEFLGRSANYHPCRDIAQIFEEVSSGHCELGVVPLENSLQGTVGVSFDLFLKYPVRIVAELYSRISNSLLSNAESMAAIEKVYSHPQPLAQCGGWLRAHLPNAPLIPVESTAAAASRAAREPGAAAIGNIRLGEMHGLEVIASGIEDSKGNWTRFVIIATEKMDVGSAGARKSNGGKTSLLFTLPDKPGSLAAMLDLLAKGGVNMRKLESRPMHGQPWRYVFFADVESDLSDPAFADLLKQLENNCNSFRILGSYPTGPQLDRATPWAVSGKESSNDE